MTTLVGQSVESTEKATSADLTLTSAGLSDFLTIGFAEVRQRREMMKVRSRVMEYILASFEDSVVVFELAEEVVVW